MLYVVPTPIGNLKDITFRAIEILQSVDYILCEDTRTSAVLLNHYQISTKKLSYHSYNEHRILTKIIQLLQSGSKMALISDAGTPGISDPAYLLIQSCLKNNIAFSCLPGATALIPALIHSGFPNHQFVFEGFLPPKKGRQKKLKELATEPRTIIFYESPHRLLKTLDDLALTFGAERKACVCREISKLYEESIRKNLAELILHFKTNIPKGECVIVLCGIDY
ncbi:MAG: 16S rRNA (cytidine(1402)-2'-O)-methyltransferase [Sediminibacterium sp.]|nr:16S rRNA (cytidine(1402)-2'-O)-methyltransferase [Sediminibacterium sp.]